MTTLLHELRRLTPVRPLRFAEGLRVAELQAATLLRLSGVTDAPVPDRIITELPRMQVERVYPLGVSGFSQWSKGRWLVVLNAAEPATRQRFSLAHEFKHVLDHPFVTALYPNNDAETERRIEQVCDQFAACLLMPRPWVKRAWASGLQDTARLAAHFDVSVPAIQMRLRQMGLVENFASRHNRVAA